MKTALRHFCVILAYSLVVVVMTAPVFLYLSTHVIGEGGDPWQTMWRFSTTYSWLQSSLSSGQLANLVLTEFFGGGEARLVNLSVWPWMPLHALFGEPLAYNISWLMSYIMSGYFMYLLIRWLIPSHRKLVFLGLFFSESEAGAFIAGLTYMFLPFHVAHSLGHFGAMQTQWLPLAILLTFVFIRRPTLFNSLGLTGVLIIQAWTEHHYILWYAIFALIYLMWERRLIVHLWRKGRIAYVGLVVGLLALFVILPYWPTVRLAAVNSTRISLGAEQTIRFSTDLFAPVVPAVFHSIWGGLTSVFSNRFTGNSNETTAYLGISVLLLVVFFGQRVPRMQRNWWFFIAVLFYVISLGPRLHIMGWVIGIPLPYSLISGLPIFKAVRVVARAEVLVGLSVCVLLGWVIASQIKRASMLIFVSGLILFDLMFLPVPLQSAKLSNVYDAVRALPGRAIVEIPAATVYQVASKALYGATVHGKQVIGDIALERGSDQAIYEEVRSMPALRQLLFLRTGQIRLDRNDFFEQALPETLADVFDWYDVRAIIVNEDSLTVLQRATVDAFLREDVGLDSQAYEDAMLYRAEAEDMPEHDGVFIARDGRWEAVGYDEKRQATFAEINQGAQVTVYNANNNVSHIHLLFIIDQASLGKLTVRNGSSVYNLAGQVDKSVSIDVILPPQSNRVVDFESSEGRVILRDPRYEVVQ